MKIYSSYGVNDFVICLGYKGYVIKEYFCNYFTHMSDITLDLCTNSIKLHKNHCEPWRVTLVDTGELTMSLRLYHRWSRRILGSVHGGGVNSGVVQAGGDSSSLDGMGEVAIGPIGCKVKLRSRTCNQRRPRWPRTA